MNFPMAKPSRFAVNWALFYFHRNPASLTGQVQYNEQGHVVPSQEEQKDAKYCLVVSNPAMLIIPWTIMIFISLFDWEFTAPCWLYQVGTKVSALIPFLSLMVFAHGIYTIQKCYKYHFPGTPAIQIDIQGLKRYYHRFKYVYYALSVILLLLFIGTIIVSWTPLGCLGDQKECEKCSKIVISYWSMFHFLAAISIHRAGISFKKKHKVLANPPSYEMTTAPLPFYPETEIAPVYNA
jgi:hypothetical protein